VEKGEVEDVQEELGVVPVLRLGDESGGRRWIKVWES
jgi:hypothetical protein